MNIQDCIKLICEINRWEYEGSFMRESPSVPANCNYGGFSGGLRERRYEFILEASCETITFNTREVRCRARALQTLRWGEEK